jgi:HAD superfamily hydrolase (TIGR01490 family)
MIPKKARDLVEEHQLNGHECIIITATQSFVSKPIAGLFNVQHLIATEPEIINGQFTGKLKGTPCFQGGKLIRLQEFLKIRNIDLKSIPHIYAYSDSYNDIPLLELADTPVAVNPDLRLSKHALEQGWQIMHTSEARRT